MEVTFEGIIKNYRYQSSDSLYKVASVETLDGDEVSIVGYFPLLQTGISYMFSGIEQEHEKYGKQIKLNTFKKMDITTKKGVVAYLAGEQFKGIGEKTAEKIYDALGEDCLSKILKDPTSLDLVPGFPKKLQNNFILALKSGAKIETIYVELYNYGLTSGMISRLYEKYDEKVLDVLRANPYQLIYDIAGFGFKKSDSIAKKIGFSNTDERRLKEGLMFTLQTVCSNNGFTFLTKKQLINSALQLLQTGVEMEVNEQMLEEQLDSLIQSGRIICEENRIYVQYLYKAECELAEKILLLKEESNKKKFSSEEINETIKIVEDTLNISYTDQQIEALHLGINHNLAIISGGPGTGKTTILKGLLYLYAYLNKLEIDSNEISSKILLIAPTGRAAKRMTETTGLPASTIHRALGYDYEGHFTFDANNKLPYSFIVVDESSMIDVILANNLFSAMQNKVKVVLVGDEFQLPSVGPGNVLHDLITSQVFHTIRLVKIMRQAEDSAIVSLAKDIKNQTVSYDIFTKKKQLFFYNSDSDEVVGTIRNLMQLFLAKGGDIYNGIQILAPMYNGVAGIDAINEMIQREFNTSTEKIVFHNKMFKVNDKVMQLINDPKNNIMNGDIGIIRSIMREEDNSEYLMIDFDTKMIKYSVSDCNNLNLAYAISIHKSQGSEYDNVIIPIVPSYFVMLKRKNIYTAVTRAKKKLIIIGKYQSLLHAVATNDDVIQTSLERRLQKNKKTNIIYINDPQIPFDTLGEENMENISPYTFMPL